MRLKHSPLKSPHWENTRECRPFLSKAAQLLTPTADRQSVGKRSHNNKLARISLAGPQTIARTARDADRAP